MMGMREFVAERLRVPSGGQRGEAEITPRRVEPRRYESATRASRSSGARNCRKCRGQNDENAEDGILNPEENEGAAEQARRVSLPQPTYLFVSIRVIRVEPNLLFQTGHVSGG